MTAIAHTSHSAIHSSTSEYALQSIYISILCFAFEATLCYDSRILL